MSGEKGSGRDGPSELNVVSGGKTQPTGGAGQGRWLEGSASAPAMALRQALDEAATDESSAFARQRVWNRVQIPWAGEPESPSEPAVVSRRGRHVSILTGAGLALAATAAIFFGVRVWQTPPPITALPAPAAPLVEAVPLPPPASIALTTGPDELGRYRLSRGVAVELAARSALIPGDDNAPPEVKVGKVRFSVPKQAPGRRYVVRAGGYRVVVLGTTFDVAVDDRGVAVSVSSGLVVVENAATGRQLARLGPGMAWPGDVSPGKRRVRARAVAGAGALQDPGGARSLDEAVTARRRGDARGAIAQYQRLVEAGGPLAEIALYEIGVIEAEDLLQPRRALLTWQRHRDRYPSGLLRAEADLSVVDALARVGEQSAAFAEARAFLTRHPTSERRAEVARVAGDLARTRGDCRTAIGFYEIGAAQRHDLPDVDDAAYHRAACLRTLGDARATAAARDYLARFPFGRHAVDAQRLVAGGKVDSEGR